MKTSAVICSLAALAASATATNPFWSVTNLRTLTTTSTTLSSSLHFRFEDPSSNLTTKCQYVNAPGSGRPATVLTPTPCENQLVKFTYIQTSNSTGQISINVTDVNAAGNTQGVQSGLGIADLACHYDAAVSGTKCYAQNTEITPGPETA